MATDPITLESILEVGSALVGGALVKEMTKDAYTAVKNKILALIGCSTPDTAPAASDAELAAATGNLTEGERKQLGPLLKAFVECVQGDAEALKVLSGRGLMNLDLDAQGDVKITRVTGPEGMDVKARASGDITISDVTFDNGARRGN